ncbi:MAG TPA: hypothetical protein VLA03_02250 [Draconibacterium sp.]|nr:hypothetical protein [Draconibacterium sp.]
MKQKWILYLLTAVLGVLSILLPVFFQAGLKHYESSLFSLIRDCIEGISMWSFALLFSTGFVMRFYTKLSGWKIGLATMALFPVMAILELSVDSTSHNLLPLEIIMYAIYAIPAIIGAYIGQGVQRITQKKANLTQAIKK